MENWKEVIKSRLEKHNSRRTEIHTALMQLKQELRMSPYNLDMEVSDCDDDRLLWKVRIGKRTASITNSDVDYWQREDDGMGGRTGERVTDVKTALQGLLVSLFLWEE